MDIRTRYLMSGADWVPNGLKPDEVTMGSAFAMPARFVVPVSPYTSEIPNSNTPDENAPRRKYFIAASLDFLSRLRKPTRMYTDTAINSSEMNSVSRSTPEAMNIMPTTENRMSE